MAISKESKQLIKAQIDILQNKRVDIVSQIQKLNAQLVELEKNKKEIQGQINDLQNDLNL